VYLHSLRFDRNHSDQLNRLAQSKGHADFQCAPWAVNEIVDDFVAAKASDCNKSQQLSMSDLQQIQYVQKKACLAYVISGVSNCSNESLSQ
jgi:hypothetical protein